MSECPVVSQCSNAEANVTWDRMLTGPSSVSSSITDGAVEPLKAELAELDQLIRDQQDRICAVKASILKNEEKIQKMVYSINLSSRR